MLKRTEKMAAKIANDKCKALRSYDDDLHRTTKEEAYNQLMEHNMMDYVNAKIFILQAEARFQDEIVKRGLTHLTNSNKVKGIYFITIRPDQTRISFEQFYTLVCKFVQRTCFDWFEFTFEQKGTEVPNLGTGFHTHILAKMTQRSKGEVLRDTISSFKHCTADNCIQIDHVRTERDIATTRAYMVEYVAKDGHKKITQEADKMWRQQLGLRSLYTDVDELRPYSSLPYQVHGEANMKISFN